MEKFRPIPNVRLTNATCLHQAEQIVTFLNSHSSELHCTFYARDCMIYATSIKQSRIDYILGVIAGFILSK
jgi:hypothetical protein